MRVAVCLSIDQGKLLGGHSGVEAGGQKGEETTTSPEGLSYPKAIASVRMEIGLEECHSAAEADLPMARNEHKCEATYSRAMGLAVPWYCRGKTSVEASIPCSHGGRALVVKGAEKVENAEANSKYQDRAKAKELQ
ncbi:hypothetical protein B296_00046667 [Ensete ventricosum]|uniref:Uncharacterized protein n=1 Tax=Ensete ventricosum TaxID=4639 RepID=A0A426Y0S3_ENSVE|nr:hypothetical protein B296_00046667 [Ensete ventricosum]